MGTERLKFLITGADGQVGRALIDCLAARGQECLGFGRRDLDISSPQQVSEVLRSTRPAAVINCAAYNHVDKAESEPDAAFAINRDGPKYLADVCADTGSILVHFSTDYVFDGMQVEAYAEEAPAQPLGVYGASKLAGEREVLQSDALHLVVRVSWVFGRIGKSFIDDVLKWADNGPLKVVDDQRSVPCDAVALAAATVRAISVLRERRELGGLYHFAMGPAVSRHEYATRILDRAAEVGLVRRVPIEAVSSSYFATAATRPRNSTLGGQRFEEAFGMAPGSWEGGLEEYLDLLKEQRAANASLEAQTR
jgi:dTDP-4-dehydrorhamnose reductase